MWTFILKNRNGFVESTHVSAKTFKKSLEIMMTYGGFSSAKGAEEMTTVSKSEILVDLFYQKGFAIKEDFETFKKRKGRITHQTCKRFNLYSK